MNLKDKVIVITGSSKGLGKALAKIFVDEGAKVVISARQESGLAETAQELGVVGIPADVTQEDDLKNLAEKTIAQLGGIDIWINNAGVWLPHMDIEEYDMERVKKMFDVNVFGLMNGCRVALRAMRPVKQGTIVNICSTSGLSARPKAAAYSGSKWAVNGISKAVTGEGQEHGISVVTVFPGGIKTNLFDEVIPDDIQDFMEPSHVAGIIVSNLKLENPEAELVIKRPGK